MHYKKYRQRALQKRCIFVKRGGRWD